MDSLEDMEMQMLSSRIKRNFTVINEIEEKCNERVQSLPNLDKCNKNLSKKVMKMCNELQRKENEIRHLNIDKDILSTKQYHLDQSINDKLMDIEKLQKTNEEINNDSNKIHSDLSEQLFNYEATINELANKYKESAKFHDEDFLKATLQETDAEIQNLQHELKEAMEETYTLEEEFKNMKENVPDLIAMAGKEQLLKVLENLTTELEKLQKIHDEIVAKQRTSNPHYADN